MNVLLKEEWDGAIEDLELELEELEIELAVETNKCSKCNKDLIYDDDFREFFNQDYGQSGGEYLYCADCDLRIDL